MRASYKLLVRAMHHVKPAFKLGNGEYWLIKREQWLIDCATIATIHKYKVSRFIAECDKD